MKFRKYTKEDFILAISTSKSVAEALRKLGVAPHGGNYAVVRKYVKLLQLDTSHMTRQGWNKGRVFGPKRPIEKYLSNEFEMGSNSLRKRLIKEKFVVQACYHCFSTTWCNQSIPLELHHVDGNSKNNNLSNLQLLCPNCHALTSTYRGKNQKRKKTIDSKKKNIKSVCLDCDKLVSYSAFRCKSCASKFHNKTKIDWPPTEELIELVKTHNYLKVSRILGVSDSAVRKRIKHHPT